MRNKLLFGLALSALLYSPAVAFSQSKDFVWSPPDGKSNTESVSQSSPPVAECVPSSPFISSRSNCSVSCGDGTLTVQWSNVCTSWQTSEACSMPACPKIVDPPVTKSCVPKTAVMLSQSACSVSCGDGTRTIDWSNTCSTWQTVSACSMPACPVVQPTWKIMGLYRDASQVDLVMRPFGDWSGHFDDPVILPISKMGDQWPMYYLGGNRWASVTYLQMSSVSPPTLMTSTTRTDYATNGTITKKTTTTSAKVPNGFMPVYDRGTCAFPTQDGTYYLNTGDTFYVDKSSHHVYYQYVESFDFKAICRSDGTYDIYLAYYQNNIPNALLPNGQWPSGYPSYTYMGNHALQPGFMKDWAMQMWRLPYQKWVKTTPEKYFTSPFTYETLLGW